MHSFLLIGQSNMAGRGFFDEAHPIDVEHLYVLRNGRWIQLFRPVNADRKTSGVCLAESFAEAYSKEKNVDVGLIACADGGTQISQWMPGEILYEHAVFQTKLAIRQSTLAGILWHQGESDCKTGRDGWKTYKETLEFILKSMFKDIGVAPVPVVVGGLADFVPAYHHNDLHLKINEALIDMANQHETVGFASAEGLKSNPDGVHFCSDALYEFGLRYYEAYKKASATFTICDEQKDANLKRSELELL